MKQKDLLLVVVIVAVSAVFSFVISGVLFGSPSDRQQEVEQVDAISTTFPDPDKRFFNKQAFDPTQVITINPYDNADPFKGDKQ